MSPHPMSEAFVQDPLLIIERVDDIRHVVVPEPNEVTSGSHTTQEAAVVDLRLRAGHLALALTHIASANKLTGMVKALNTVEGSKIAASYGPALPDLMQGVHFKLASESTATEREFRAAYEAGEGPVEAGDETFRSAYQQFLGRYEGTENAQERDAARKRFKKLAKLPGEPVRGTVYRIDTGEEATVTAYESDEALETLDTRAKLLALQADPRAGFLPTTNEEKNQAIELLDYLDNEKYPGGVFERLSSIYGSQIKVFINKGMSRSAAQEQAKESVFSVINEYADYAHNAHESNLHLGLLASIVKETDSPNVTLATLLQERPELAGGVAELVRYHDLVALRAGILEDLPFKPLETVTNRDIESEIKHKQIEDKYTATQRLPEVDDHISHVAAQLKVGYLRNVIKAAVDDQAQREQFWTDILQGIRYTYRGMAEVALRSAIQ